MSIQITQIDVCRIFACQLPSHPRTEYSLDEKSNDEDEQGVILMRKGKTFHEHC